LWLRSSVVSVLLSVTAGTVPTGTSIVTLIFGTRDAVRGLLRSSHGLTRYCSTGELGPLPHGGETIIKLTRETLRSPAK